METILANRCFNHPGREAVAVCFTCGRDFCRECVTEHRGRMVCSPCLEKSLAGPLRRRKIRSAPLKALSLVAGVLLLWVLFYYMGRALIFLPSSFHEGTVWKVLGG